MLFNSYSFIFMFLPVAVSGFFLVGKMVGKRYAIFWLTAASLFFYAWWKPIYVTLLLSSILVNYQLGSRLSTYNQLGKNKAGRAVLSLGIVANLALIGYYKYANFFVTNINDIFNSGIKLETLILPIAISFFTFQQIAYLIDAYRAETEEHSFLDYCLFISFFPQLIAGPIVHHKEILPQFKKSANYSADSHSISMGLSIFAIGLFKKVILADGLAIYATPVFNSALNGNVLTFVQAWTGSFCYTFQIYFDFSGYSDMAIGLALLFGIRLPLNFHSPYKSTNIIDFWRRWHMTLSRFLRDYLYFPLGGNRRGRTRRYINLMVTMLLGGLWHGANWTFVIWGGLHGTYLVVNHAWHAILRKLGRIDREPTTLGRTAAQLLTFLMVVIGWVFFRSENFHSAMSMLGVMIGLNGLTGLDSLSINAWLNAPLGVGTYLLAAFIIAWFMPNTQQIMAYSPPAQYAYRFELSIPDQQWWHWKPNVYWLIFFCTIGSIAVGNLIKVSEFLYYQF